MNNLQLREGVGNRRGAFTPLVLFGFVALGLIGVTVYFLNFGESGNSTIDPIMATVEEGEFVAQVLDQGELQSSENIEIRCEARARNGTLTVIEVIKEGSRVRGGDFLVRLDSSAFELELETQKILLATAETLVIQANAEYQTAVEALKEYEQGLFVEKKKTIENAIYAAKSLIETAKQELTLAKAVLEHSKKLQGKGFITSQQLEADGFEVKRAEFALESAINQLTLAETQERVLVEITQVKETVLLKSNIESAKVKLANQKESLSVEKSKLQEIKDQIELCEIRVPQGLEGQVVFGRESSRGDDWVLEEGTLVRERQVLIRLPNPDRMEVKALINEQSITQIRVGMPASIKVDALNNQLLRGVVTKVNQYAESNGWFGSSVRKYAVLVQIVDPPESLKPGMNAAVTIETRFEPDAVIAPIQTVYAVQNQKFCLMKTAEGKWETREVEVDGDNAQVVLIKNGVKPGDQLVLNPGAYTDLMDLPEIELDRKIEISDKMKSEIDSLKGKDQQQPVSIAANDRPQPDPANEAGPVDGPRPAGAQGPAGFDMPASGLALIKQKDTDSDGKLTKDEVGSPFSMFFDRIDTDSDGFLTTAEADKSIQQMKSRMQQGGSGGVGGGGGRVGGPSQ